MDMLRVKDNLSFLSTSLHRRSVAHAGGIRQVTKRRQLRKARGFRADPLCQISSSLVKITVHNLLSLPCSTSFSCSLLIVAVPH